MFKRILVPTDGSDITAKAVTTALLSAVKMDVPEPLSFTLNPVFASAKSPSSIFCLTQSPM